MKKILLISIALGLSSCAGWTFKVTSPYGDIISEDQDSFRIYPKTIVIPTK